MADAVPVDSWWTLSFHFRWRLESNRFFWFDLVSGQEQEQLAVKEGDMRCRSNKNHNYRRPQANVCASVWVCAGVYVCVCSLSLAVAN